jgi:hypothetical protein
VLHDPFCQTGHAKEQTTMPLRTAVASNAWILSCRVQRISVSDDQRKGWGNATRIKEGPKEIWIKYRENREAAMNTASSGEAKKAPPLISKTQRGRNPQKFPV